MGVSYHWLYLSYSIKSMSKDTNWTSCRKAEKHYEYASTQRISFPWTLPEESIREWVSHSKVNLTGLGVKNRGKHENTFFYRTAANGSKNEMAAYPKQYWHGTSTKTCKVK